MFSLLIKEIKEKIIQGDFRSTNLQFNISTDLKHQSLTCFLKNKIKLRTYDVEKTGILQAILIKTYTLH